MRRILTLTWRYLAFHRFKTLILLAALTITMFLPLAAHIMITYYERDLVARAETTPLVLGAKGNRYDLILKSLYFTAEDPESVTMAQVNTIRNYAMATPVPLHVSFTARGKPVVGTTLDYFEFRDLDVASGTLPMILGDAVVGSLAADELGLKPGDKILTDQTSLYNIAAVYPLKLNITGILAETGTPDDRVLFVDIKTAWIIEGIGHGHQDLVTTDDEAVVLERREGAVIANAAIINYTQISEKNIDSFHFHGDQSEFPITSVIIIPDDKKSGILLRGRYDLSPTEQILVPTRIINELMGIVFQIKKFFDATFALVCVAAALFITLIVLLSLRLRKREMETMLRIGCSRMTIFRIHATELLIVLAASLVTAILLAVLLLMYAPDIASVI